MGCDLFALAALTERHTRFSILERIEWAATTTGGVQPRNDLSFQYPRTDRMGCDADDAPRLVVFDLFQYPRTDRMGCD